MFNVKALAVAAMAICLAMPAYGQTTRPFREGRGAASRPGERRGGEGFSLLERAQKMVNDLKLSDEQKEKVSEIFDKAREDARSMRQDLANVSPQERGDRIREFVSSLREKIGGVLTDEQKKEFQQKMQELRGGAAGGAGGGMVDRLRDSLQKLDLSDEQRAKIKDLFEEVQSKVQQAREEADGQADQMREKIRPIAQDAREKLQSILTADQQKKLRELMGREEGPASQPSKETRSPKGRGLRAERRNNARDASLRTEAPSNPTTGLAVGEMIPDLEIRKLDGSSVQLSSYRGHVLVIEFGSYSSPAFRSRVSGMEQLKNQTGGVAMFLLVYTKESHPAGGWELDRNKDEKISIAQHKSMTDRKNAALKARSALKISIPILLDDMDDSVAKALNCKENSLLIIGKDGTVVARQEWADPTGARRIIEEAARSIPATNPIR